MPRAVWRRPNPGPSVRNLLTPYVKSQRRRLIPMSVAAVLGGFAEAAVLVLIARIAFALSSPNSGVKVGLGPVGSVTISINALIGIAAVLVVVRIALQILYTVLAARASAGVTA